MESYFIVEAACLQPWANTYYCIDAESLARAQEYWYTAKCGGLLRPSNDPADYYLDQHMFNAIQPYFTFKNAFGHLMPVATQPQPTFKIPSKVNCAVSIKPPTRKLTVPVAASS